MLTVFNNQKFALFRLLQVKKIDEHKITLKKVDKKKEKFDYCPSKSNNLVSLSKKKLIG